jgi:hypothetical protein
MAPILVCLFAVLVALLVAGFVAIIAVISTGVEERHLWETHWDD